MNTLSETQKAYLAGFIDGEGCISITKKCANSKHGEASDSYTLLMTTTQVDERTLRMLHKWTGIGNIFYSNRKHIPNHRDLWSWSLSGKEAVALLRELLPYLHLKKPQAELAIEFSQITGWTNGRNHTPLPETTARREAMFQAIRALKNLSGHMTDRVVIRLPKAKERQLSLLEIL